MDGIDNHAPPKRPIPPPGREEIICRTPGPCCQTQRCERVFTVILFVLLFLAIVGLTALFIKLDIAELEG